MPIRSGKIDDGEFGNAGDKVIHRFGLVEEETDVACIGGIGHLAEDVESQLEDVIRKVAVDLIAKRM